MLCCANASKIMFKRQLNRAGAVAKQPATLGAFRADRRACGFWRVLARGFERIRFRASGAFRSSDYVYCRTDSRVCGCVCLHGDPMAKQTLTEELVAEYFNDPATIGKYLLAFGECITLKGRWYYAENDRRAAYNTGFAD
jgi:hypothetical protein